MTGIIAKTPWAVTGNASKLFLDYAAAPRDGLPTFIGGVRGDKSFWEKQRDERAVRDPVSAWPDVLESVVSLSRRLGTRSDVLDKLGKPGGECTFVVTGQQPGTLGGPLHTVYKVASAVSLASFLEGLLDQPVVPLYWCGGDDTDFGEIRQLSLFTRTFDPVSASIAQSAHRGGMPVGDIGLSPLTTLWHIVRGFTASFDHGDSLERRISAAFENARDHGELAAAILIGLFDGRVAVVDGRMGSVRRCAQPVIADYVRGEDEIKDLIRREGERLEKKGYHAQIAPAQDSGVFLVENGLRKNVAAGNRSVLLRAVEQDIEKCSPGVVARNLVQDHVFRPLAVVLGPSELAYRAQIGALYERFGIRRPVELPRMGATFLPPEIAELVESGDAGEAEALVENPNAYVKTLYRSSVPRDLEASVDELQAAFSAAMETFAHRAMDGLPEKLQQKIRARLDEVSSRVDNLTQTTMASGKAVALERWPFLGRVGQLLNTNDKPQERWLSGLFPFLYGGDATGTQLTDLAHEYIDELVDSRARHIVYSCRS